jgi:branched-chain amino acid transport system substrate-binding protein
VQIAAQGPFTGDQADIGMGALQAVNLAIQDFNKTGGVNGTPVQLVIWDDHHDASVAAKQQEQASSDQSLLGLVGPMNADVAIASGQRLQNAQLPFVSESIVDPKLTDAGLAVAHRVSARAEKQGALAAQFMIKQGAKKIEVIDSGSEYSRPIADAVQTRLQSSDQVATERSSVRPGGKDFRSTVNRAKAFNADWVFLADEGPDAVVLAQQMAQAGLKIGQNIQLLASDQVNDPRLLASAGGALDGAYATQITADPQSLPSGGGFVSAFKRRYGNEAIASAGPFYGSAYAATEVLLAAIKASPVRDGKIARSDVLQRLGSDTFSTILGPIKFDAKGDVQKAVITIWRAQGDKLVPMTAVRE